MNEVLLEAAKDGNLIVLKTAFEKGADINAKSSDGKTALMVALEIGHTELVNYLTEKGAEVSIEKKTEIIKREELESMPNPNWKIVFGRTGQGIMVMNADGSGLSSLLDWGEMPNASPDGIIIVYISGICYSQQPLPESDSEYYHSQLDSTYRVTRLPFEAFPFINSSPDIYLIDTNGTNIKKLISNVEMGSSFPKFSPDGKRIAFKGTKNNETQLFVVDANGRNLNQLTHGESVDYFYWIFDNRIVFETRNGEKIITDYNGRNLERLTIFEKDEYEPVWDSVGKKIAFCKGSDLFVMDTDGKNRQCLTDIRGWIGNWSPDGQWIVFSSRKMNGNGADIFIIRKDGKHECRLTDLYIQDGEIGGDFDPCWLP